MDLKQSLAKKNSIWNEIYNHKTFYIFLLPAILTTLIFAYLPMVGVVMAFQKYDLSKGYFGSPFIGFQNFLQFLQDPIFFKDLRNTVVMNVLHIIIGFPIPIILALMLNSIKDGFYKKVSQTISYLPHFISWVVISGLVYKMLDLDYGVVNLAISALGGNPIPFIRQPESFWMLFTITGILKEAGWGSIIYLAALSSIDQELYSAAAIDGADGRQKLFHITIPGILPVISLMLIFTMGTLVAGNFEAIYNMRNALVSDTSDTLDYYVYALGIQKSNLSLASSIGLAVQLVSFSFVMTANTISRKLRGYGAF